MKNFPRGHAWCSRGYRNMTERGTRWHRKCPILKGRPAALAPRGRPSAGSGESCAAGRTSLSRQLAGTELCFSPCPSSCTGPGLSPPGCAGAGEPGQSPGVESVGGSVASCSAQVVPRCSAKPLRFTRRRLQTWQPPQSAFFTRLGFLWPVSLGEGKFCPKKSLWHQLP